MTMAKTIVHQVKSWDALLATAKARPTAKNLHSNAGSSSRDGSEEFCGATYAGALRMMEFGWQDGVRAAEGHIASVPTADNAPTWDLDVAGVLPCVPAYVSGDPCCMFVREDGPTVRPHLALAINSAYHCGIDVPIVLKYAAALGIVLSELEASGIDVALYAVEALSGNAKRHVIPFTVREFGEPMDMSRLVYAVHPSFLRRVLFANAEMETALAGDGLAQWGYGHPFTVDAETAWGAFGNDAIGIMLPALQDHEAAMRHRDGVQTMAALMREAVRKALEGPEGVPA